MSWFKKTPVAEIEETKPTFYIDTPVEIQKQYQTWKETDDSGAKIEKVSDEKLIYTARTTVGGVEVEAEQSRYIGFGYWDGHPEAKVLETLRENLYHRVEKTKELQADLPLGTWLPVDWSAPRIELEPRTKTL